MNHCSPSDKNPYKQLEMSFSLFVDSNLQNFFMSSICRLSILVKIRCLDSILLVYNFFFLFWNIKFVIFYLCLFQSFAIMTNIPTADYNKLSVYIKTLWNPKIYILLTVKTWQHLLFQSYHKKYLSFSFFLNSLLNYLQQFAAKKTI